ncbi:MAG: serine protein kinase RIO [Nitrosopumilus sp. B06]|nr:MAG: serine protein kinase RIO [Nitrosopumilus sp. D6]RNJ78758.1 MAG: serine protein kinase RIO [Nitrosopumilus sp. B06]
MPDDLDERIESRMDKKLARKKKLDDGFKGNKVVNEVLDKSTVMTLYKMIRNHVISYVNGPISAGKESVVFWGVADDADVALKIYLVSTSNFKKREAYITGDPRFSRIKKGTRNLVYLWASKEFRNLSLCHNAGLPVPKPIHLSKNVLAMEFVGEGGAPCKTLLNSKVDSGDYTEAILILEQMYGAGLVHGDYSEYNIFKTGTGLMVFDLGSAVDIRHPNSAEFLKRDINNITRFFHKRGVQVEEADDVFGRILR